MPVEEVNGGDVLVIHFVVVKKGLNVFVEPGLVVSTQYVQLARVAAFVHEDAAHDNACDINRKVINLRQTLIWDFVWSWSIVLSCSIDNIGLKHWTKLQMVVT